MASGDDLTAGTLNFVVTGANATVGEALDQGNGALEVAAGTINANVALPSAPATDFVGSFVITDADHTNGSAGGVNPSTVNAPMTIGTFNAGNGTVILTSRGGSILGTAGAAPNITALQLNLVADKFAGPNLDVTFQPAAHYGAVGSSANPLRTSVTMLSATATDGGLFISEADSVMINRILVQERGLTPQTGGSGAVVVVPSGQDPIAGTSDATITVGGDVVLLDVKVADQFSITATGAILDGNQDSNNVLARGLSFQTGTTFGSAADAIDTTVMTVQGTTTNGGVFIAETDGITVNSIIAGGAGSDVTISTGAGAFVLGTITTTGGDVSVKSSFESIMDGNGAAVNITGATATLEARTGLGTALDPLEVNVGGLSTKVTGRGAGTFVNSAGMLTSLSLETNNGAVGLTLTGGSVGFVQPGTNNQLSLAAPGISTFSFSNTGGSVAINSVNAGTGAVSITAQTAITDFAADTVLNLTGGAVTLKAGTFIGTQANALETNLDTLTATADAGGVFITDSGAVTSLTVTAKGAGNDVFFTAGGDLAVAKVIAPDVVNLNSTGNLTRIGNVLNIAALSATLQAGGAIGASASPLLVNTRTMTSAIADNGGIFLRGKGTLTATLVRATGGDVELNSENDLTLGTIETGATQTLKLSSIYGAMLDGNGAAVNIRGGTADLTAARVGTNADALETDLGTVKALATGGGIYLSEANGITVTTLEAQGLGGDVSLTAAGNIVLGLVKAEGDKVNIRSTGGNISDGNGSALNITANQLDIAATAGIGALQNNVNQLGAANGGTGGVTISNVGAISLTDATLEGRGASKLTIEADSITILDMADNAATLDLNGSIQLTARTGNVVFLDTRDSIVTTGTGTIGISAGLGITPAYPNTGAVAVVGNLTTAGGAIEVRANHHVTIGLLSTLGNGNVTVVSEAGVIIDGNGAAKNIIGNVVTLSGALPGDRIAQLESSIRTADYSAIRSEAAAKLTSAQSFGAATVIMDAQQKSALSAKDDAASKESEAESESESADAEALTAYIVATTLDGVATGLGIARDIVAIPAGAAQAIPLTGDGGAMTGYSVLDVAANIADLAAFVAGIVADQLGDAAEEKANGLVKAGAEFTALSATFQDSFTTWQAFNEATSIAQKAADVAAIARDHALQVRDQSIAAEDQDNVIGTAANPLGVEARQINATTADGSVYLAVAGDFSLGGVSASGTSGVVSIAATGDIFVTGTTNAPTEVSLSAGGSIIDGGGSIQAPKFLGIAANSVGTIVAPIHTTTGVVALKATTGTVGITNIGALEIGSITATHGVTSAGAVGITSTGSLTFTKTITATGQAVTLLSTTGSIIDSHTGSAEVTAQTLTATAATGLELDTNISSLDATVTGGGFLKIREANGITLTSAKTANGAISVEAGGPLVATSVVSQTDADANDIFLKTTNGGFLQAGTINAGSGAGDVTLDTTGSLTMLTGGRITADALVVKAVNDVTITTTANSADILVTGTGGITVSESDALIVNRLATSIGAINLTAGGAVTVQEGAVNAAAGASNVTVNATGMLTGPMTGNGSADILGAIVNLITNGAGGAVGGSLLNPLEINATTRLDLTTASSNAFIDDIAGGVVIGTANTGTGDLYLKAIAGGITSVSPGNNIADIVAAHVDLKVTGATSRIGIGESTQLDINATSLTIATDGGSAYLADTAGGVAINALDVGTGDLFLTATGGAITDNNGATNNVTAKNLMLSATAGVGTAGAGIEVVVTAFEGSGGTGGINVADASGGLTLGGVTNGLGGVSATGGKITITTQGALTVNEAVSNTGGDILLTAADTAGAGDDLTLNADLTAASPGGIELQGGDHVSLTLGVTLSATGGTVDIRGDHGDLDTAVGSAVTLNGAVRANRLQVTTGADNDTVLVKDTVLTSVAINTGGGNDEVTITTGNTLGTGTIDAGSGNDQVTTSVAVQNVIGNDGNDQLLIKAGGSVTGAFHGGADSDTVIYDHDGLGGDDYVGPVTVNLQTQSATGIAAFSGIEAIEATTNANDKLIGANANGTWHITGTNAGDIGGPTVFKFSGFESLTGGTGDDAFQFATGGSITGNLDGGGHTLRDTLDYDTANFGATAAVTLDGSNGGVATAIGGRFDRVEEFIGDSDFTNTNSLVGGGTNSVWAITGLYAGNISNQFFFKNVGSSSGGAADDTFAYGNNTLPPAIVNGGNGINTLDLSAWTANLRWNITGDGSGNVVTPLGTFAFTGMTHLIGGSANDRFIFSDDKILGQGLLAAGSITGNGGSDFIDVTAYTTANVWTRTGLDGTISSARGTWTYSSIEDFLGSKTTTFKYDVVDLIGTVNKVAIPAQLLPGQGGTVVSKIFNIGNQEVRNQFVDISYYLSLDDTLDAGDVLIGETSNKLGRLRPGHEIPEFSARTTVPRGTAAGNYHLLTFIDSGNVLAEGDETNNVVDAGMVEVLPVLVDLQPTITKSFAPQSLLGGMTTLTAKVTNAGNSPAVGTADVEFFLSQDGTIDGSDIALGGIIDSTLNLGAGASRNFSFDAQIPTGMAVGSYQVLVRVDGKNQIAEIDEVNNVASAANVVNVNQPFIDLTGDFSRGRLPTIGIPNDVLKFQLPVKNSGNIAAIGKADIKFYLSVDGTVDPNTDILLKSLQNVAINVGPNGEQIISTSAIIPTSAQNGTYFVLADIDSGNTLDESNNANNTAVLSDGLEVVWRFGSFADRKNVKLTVPDSNGKMVTFSLDGRGVGNVIGGSDFSEIYLTSTNELSRVKISTKGGATTDVQEIVSTNSINFLSAPKVNLLGDFSIAGNASMIRLGDVSGSSQITIGSEVNSTRTVALTFGHVTDVNLTSATPVRSLTVRGWLDTDATPDVVQAPWFQSIRSFGDFQADIVATGATSGMSLGSLSVKGRIESDVTLAGSILSVRAGSWSGGALEATALGTFLVKGNVDDSSIRLSGLGLAADQHALTSLRVLGRVSDSIFDVQGNAGTVTVGTWGAGSVLAVGVNAGGDGTFFDGNEVATGGVLDRFIAGSSETLNAGRSFGVAVDGLRQFIQYSGTRYSTAQLPIVDSDLKLAVI